MNLKQLCALSFIWFIILIFQQALADNSPRIMLNEFKFYDIGDPDTADTATKKLNAHSFQCVQGKTTFLDIKSIQENWSSRVTTERISEIMKMDKAFYEHGRGLAIEEMPIEAIACDPLDESPFVFSVYYFSGFEQKILAIAIKIENIEMVKDKLIAKFGSCIKEGYCESQNSVLLLVENREWHLHVYFFNNLKSHYDRIMKLMELKNEKIQDNINEAF